MNAIESFKRRFIFDVSRQFNVGVEQECFVATRDGQIVPEAPRVLAGLAAGIPVQEGADQILPTTAAQPAAAYGSLLQLKNGEFGYELSACQIETRVGPCGLGEVGKQLLVRNIQLEAVLGHFGLVPLKKEVAPSTMPLDVYPDPSGRYQQIVKSLPRETLLAACRVIGTHVHVGMPDHETALRVYNRVCGQTEFLCKLGDGSDGERLAIYSQMAPDSTPRPYADWQTFYARALEKGFAEDPRKCWTLIRISVHGTIEFRMFGTTDSVARIEEWTRTCVELCREAAS